MPRGASSRSRLVVVGARGQSVVHPRPSCPADVDTTPLHGDSLLAQQLELQLTHWSGSVSSNDSLPRDVFRRGCEHVADEARRRTIDVSIGAHEARRDRPDSREDRPSSSLSRSRPGHLRPSAISDASRECPRDRVGSGNTIRRSLTVVLIVDPLVTAQQSVHVRWQCRRRWRFWNDSRARCRVRSSATCQGAGTGVRQMRRVRPRRRPAPQGRRCRRH
jgi:hypothetical protein